jgi:hypothetical protein
VAWGKVNCPQCPTTNRKSSSTDHLISPNTEIQPDMAICHLVSGFLLDCQPPSVKSNYFLSILYQFNDVPDKLPVSLVNI